MSSELKAGVSRSFNTTTVQEQQCYSIPGHTTRAPPACNAFGGDGFELTTDCIQFYVFVN